MNKRSKKWMCRIFGHSYPIVDIIKFKIISEGRAYIVNTVTGERKPYEGDEPNITCQRCKEPLCS